MRLCCCFRAASITAELAESGLFSPKSISGNLSSLGELKCCVAGLTSAYKLLLSHISWSDCFRKRYSDRCLPALFGFADSMLSRTLSLSCTAAMIFFLMDTKYSETKPCNSMRSMLNKACNSSAHVTKMDCTWQDGQTLLTFGTH